MDEKKESLLARDEEEKLIHFSLPELADIFYLDSAILKNKMFWCQRQSPQSGEISQGLLLFFYIYY